MRLDIAATTTALPPPTNLPASGATANGAVTAVSDEPVTVDTIPSSPPPEVMDAIAFAAQAYEQLGANGQSVGFRVDRLTSRITVQVRDLEGNLLSVGPPSMALDTTAGASTNPR
jgi:hypothetical protein